MDIHEVNKIIAIHSSGATWRHLSTQHTPALSIETARQTHCLLQMVTFGDHIRTVTVARVVGRGLWHRPTACRHTCCNTQSSASLLLTSIQNHTQCMYQNANYQHPSQVASPIRRSHDGEHSEIINSKDEIPRRTSLHQQIGLRGTNQEVQIQVQVRHSRSKKVNPPQKKGFKT